MSDRHRGDWSDIHRKVRKQRPHGRSLELARPLHGTIAAHSHHWSKQRPRKAKRPKQTVRTLSRSYPGGSECERSEEGGESDENRLRGGTRPNHSGTAQEENGGKPRFSSRSVHAVADARQSAGKAKGQQVFTTTKRHYRYAEHRKLATTFDQQRAPETVHEDPGKKTDQRSQPTPFTERLHSCPRRLAKRLTNAVSLHPSHRGFIPAPGVEHNSVLLEHLIRKQKKEKGTLAVAFLDLAKAFDTISHDLFAKGLERLGVPSQFIRVVEDLYDGATTSFATVNGETRQIRINQGVKQGDHLSPILFNVCLDPMFCSLEKDGKGWGNKENSITALGYVDDTAVLSDSRAGLEKNLALVKAYCDQVGLRLNVNKSYVFHIRSDGKTFTVNDTRPYEVDGRQIPWVKPEEATRYLGKMFGPWGGMSIPNLRQTIEEWARSGRCTTEATAG